MSFTIGENCNIHPSAIINVKDGYLGPRSIIREGVIIEGTRVEIGTEAYLDIRARIGGGSCFNPDSLLHAGDFLHMGVDSHINTAKPVVIGDECGVGVGTKIFTHGAYLSELDGFPVSFESVIIGDHVWLPHAWVNPGVVIGSNVVVAAGSVVTISLPDGCLAGGIPVKVLKHNQYPKDMDTALRKDLLFNIVLEADAIVSKEYRDRICFIAPWGIIMDVRLSDTLMANLPTNDATTTVFDVLRKTIIGVASVYTEAVKNQLRRHGIRFKYYAKNGEYIPW